MAISLDKAPQLHFFLAIVTTPDTDGAAVHRLALTREATYENLLEELHLQTRAIEGAELIIVIAGDRSEAYASALRGESSPQMIDRWFDQYRDTLTA
ncbi:hypothetical protein ACIP93_33620 [Streptomyces sp. NPDC088745]|uniref:hypothetical protein n=1 Tax=Streptomyces sp. NPDC088745 TaxID=3365884 RepID=UPI0037FC3C8B